MVEKLFRPTHPSSAKGFIVLSSYSKFSVDAANDLALLKADGKFSSLPIAASCTVDLGSTAATIGFPDIGLQGFAPKLAKDEIASLSGAADDPRYFQISVPVQPGNSGGALAASGVPQGGMNYAVESREGRHVAVPNFRDADTASLPFLESVPDSGFPRAAEFYHFRMREHHVRVALQSRMVMPGKPFGTFGCNQQEVRLAHQGVNPGQCQRRFRVQGFIHGDDKLGKRVQPGEPRVAGEQLQEMVRRLDFANGLFVPHPLRVNQCLVQLEQGVAKLRQALPGAFRFRWSCRFPFHQLAAVRVISFRPFGWRWLR
jgi:hypothetical protein